MFGLTSSQRTFRKCPLYTWEWQNKYRNDPVGYSFQQPAMFPLTVWRYWTLFTHSGYGWEDVYCWHLRFTEQLSLKCPLFQTICIAWNNYRDCRLCLFPPWKKKWKRIIRWHWRRRKEGPRYMEVGGANMEQWKWTWFIKCHFCIDLAFSSAPKYFGKEHL